MYFSQNYEDDEDKKIKSLGKSAPPSNIKRDTSLTNDFQGLDIKSGVKSTNNGDNNKKGKNDKEDDLWDMLNN